MPDTTQHTVAENPREKRVLFIQGRGSSNQLQKPRSMNHPALHGGSGTCMDDLLMARAQRGVECCQTWQGG